MNQHNKNLVEKVYKDYCIENNLPNFILKCLLNERKRKIIEDLVHSWEQIKYYTSLWILALIKKDKEMEEKFRKVIENAYSEYYEKVKQSNLPLTLKKIFAYTVWGIINSKYKGGMKELCRLMGISKTTYYRYLKIFTKICKIVKRVSSHGGFPSPDETPIHFCKKLMDRQYDR